ncbi:dimethylaniline monooxygenase, putative [Talaromyces stipitatus ATCC 10500]|uniref:Dimethylaniline monooxygenase, putative n=1 Tax=Talaromyces stipitatus (strain ATCC 10500 / CBS 375.48 / QM 6759 / NRRL 1006) TaxID=441959 RepID=B8LYV9_TALSN|nr:dimethylaniline monooxygenase, putative [Talaromyces stipitatus ATCC 10500]EED23467.1 dimethylaniline monooxygenase, putative [Talaromyces stipitatus ATCC 10500]
MAEQKIRRVAVIGAGPGGAIATDALVKEQAFDTIRVFERQNIAGGTWVLTPTDNGQEPRIPSLQDLINERADLGVPIPKDVNKGIPVETPATEEINSPHLRFTETGVHEHLHSNLTPEIMSFSKEPIPEILSERTRAQHGPDSPFRPREVVRAWVEDVFKRYGNDKLIEFGTTVELAEYIDTDNKQGKEWVLTLRKTVPAEGGIKNVWWQERFDAVVVASGHYYLPFVPDIPGIIEYDRKYPGKIRHSKHYRGTKDYVGRRVIVVGGSISAFDALHDIREVAKLPVISSARDHSPLFGDIPFLHPHIENRPGITSFDTTTDKITFTDGSSVIGDEIDIILFATGYDFSLPFLPDLKSVHRRIPGLYQHIFKIENPTLAFVGMIAGVFGIRFFEWQAVFIARVLAGRAKLPDRKEMYEWEQTRLAERGDGPPYWTLYPDYTAYFEELRKLAGEPAPGTTGRVLPKYESAWDDTFVRLIKRRQEWWKRAAEQASRNTRSSL